MDIEKLNELWEHNYYSMSIRELESYAKKAWLQDFYKGCLTSEDVENKVKEHFEELGIID